jgi:general secretion pathway protein K
MIAAVFSFSMKVETLAVRNFKNEAKAYFLALAGLNLAVEEIRQDYNIVYIDGSERVVFANTAGGKLIDQEIHRDYTFESGNISYSISDEQGKLNFNTATRAEMSSLLRVTGVEIDERDIIVDSILDWRDKNHDFHLNGVEDDYYLSLEEPYEAKDGPMNTAKELLLVKGVTPYIFYGMENLPMGAAFDPEYTENSTEMEYTGIEKHITVLGEGKININTADKEVLEAVVGKSKALEIMVSRESTGFFRLPVHGGSVTSNLFSVESEGESEGIVVSIKAIVERIDEKPGFKVSYWYESI